MVVIGLLPLLLLLDNVSPSIKFVAVVDATAALMLFIDEEDDCGGGVVAGAGG